MQRIIAVTVNGELRKENDMTEYKCPKCNSTNLFTRKKDTQTGLYCKECGRWIKWLNKEEVTCFEANTSQAKNNMTEFERAECKAYLEKQIKRLEISMVYADGHKNNEQEMIGLMRKLKIHRNLLEMLEGDEWE